MLQELWSEYQSRGVQFVGLNIRDNLASAKSFNRELGITYPSFDDSSGRNLLGFNKSLPTQATPTTWIIDPQGRVAVRIVVADLTATTLRGLIDEVQAGRTE